MPAGFDSCTRRGGRVRRVSGPKKEQGLKAGEYVNYCFIDGKSFRGEVRTAEKGVIEDMDFTKYIPITKVDEEKRMVYGYASTPDLDSQGEIVSMESLKKALPSYMAMPAIREMHQPKAAGLTKEAVTDEKGLYIGAKIVAEDAWKLVKEGVYRGFSIGGRIKQKIDNIIQDLDLTEISLVDVPANRNTIFTLVKREGGKLVDLQKDIYTASRLAQLAEEISFKIDSYISQGKDVEDLEEALKRLKQVIAKELKEKENRTLATEMAPKSDTPKWVEQQHEQFAKYMFGSLRKEVEEMNEIKKEKASPIEEELVEAAPEPAPATEEAPQASKETPEAPKPEVEETKPVDTVETKVSEEPPQTVVDETKQTADTAEDITKKLEKLEQTVKESPKPIKEDGLAKLETRLDYQLTKVVSVVTELAKRLAQVEKMAAPVKARPSYLVEKSDKPENAEIQKKESRLAELTKIRDTDLERYQREDMQKEALSLYDELAKLR